MVETSEIVLNYTSLKNFKSWEDAFQNQNALKVEIGCGKDDSLIERALHEPQTNFIGIESDSGIAYRLQNKIRRSKASNLKILLFEAQFTLGRFFEDKSVQAFCIQFPDPWPKKRHAKRRIFSEKFISLLRTRLNSRGELFIATDVQDMANLACEVVSKVGGFLPVDCQGQKPFPFFTLYEKKFLKLGLPIYYLLYEKQ